MNDFGEFLYTLRKEKGLTQAELAQALGVTNKAVSKWERGDAMPETGLLLPIAEIFNVTVDELLNGRRAQSDKQESKQIDVSDIIKDHLFTRGKDDRAQTMAEKICGIICAVVMLGGIAIYLCLGAVAGKWNPHWIIIPSCALSCGIISIIFNLCDGKKRKLMIAKGKNPYAENACGIIILACIIAYLLCGAVGNLWHPHWIIIVVGAAVDGIIGTISNIFLTRNK